MDFISSSSATSLRVDGLTVVLAVAVEVGACRFKKVLWLGRRMGVSRQIITDRATSPPGREEPFAFAG